MNKYIKQFMDDHNLKVEERFKIKDLEGIYWFNCDGILQYSFGGNLSYKTVLLLNGDLEVEKIKKGPWKPKYTDQFFVISTQGAIHCYKYKGLSWHDYLINHHLVFETEEEAADYKWFLDKVDEYKQQFDPERYNYFFNYNPKKERVYRTWDMVCQHQGTTYFGEKENIRKFFEEVGEDRIKKYWFNVWEQKNE